MPCIDDSWSCTLAWSGVMAIDIAQQLWWLIALLVVACWIAVKLIGSQRRRTRELLRDLQDRDDAIDYLIAEKNKR